MQFRDIDQKFGLLFKTEDITSPVTAQVLVAAPASTRGIVVDQLLVTSAVSGTAALADGDGTRALAKVFLAANSGGAEDTYYKLARGKSLTLTTTGAGAMSYSLIYHYDT